MMMPKIYLLCTLFAYCYGANILYVIPFSAKSHYLSLRPIGLELARRGHNVTVITAHLETDHPPTYHQIKVDASKVWDLLGEKRPNVFSMVDLSAEEFHQQFLWPGTLLVIERALKSPAVQELLASDMKFDLVINEQFMQEAFNVLAHKYNAPLALVTTYGNCMKHNFLSRNPLQWETVTFELLDVDDPTSFFGRLRNMYFSVYEFVWWRFWFLQKQEELVTKYIPGLTKPVPSLYNIQRNTSLMLLNGHFSVDISAAYLPNIIEVGGMHLTESDKSLPQDLQKYLDDAVHGVVYINFGSNVQSTDLTGQKRQAFMNVFKRLKQRIIFKWEEDTLEGKPDNVMIRKWLPQKEILAHPNIKVFISHGGLIGTQEAIYNGVPVIGIPVFSDQLNNILILEEMGFGKLLKFHDITEEMLYGLLKDVLEDHSYMVKAKEVSKRFKDRPMNALDTAMFWLEYVIRHNGAPFMKNPALQLNWFEYTMLDVYSFVVAVLIAIIYVIYKIISILILLMCKKSKKIKRS
ncbi:UDP-glycosyltransferase UGT5-like [Pieris brassicae]|uniref:UDP-glucuronosyltransferase n=1 Tax=Pieris brassicae TaxID=7116 RepID=A0A9P0TBI4_PIEBR|nr:UDP-glycosyltransferase UGT5-like [Pieris brassicae]CAH4028510.1 unnamed protein product [Pieris brassicae]